MLNSLLITFAREQIERSLSAMMCGLNIQLLFNVHWYSKGNKNTRLDRYQVLGFKNDRVPKQTCNRLCKCVQTVILSCYLIKITCDSDAIS